MISLKKDGLLIEDLIWKTSQILSNKKYHYSSHVIDSGSLQFSQLNSTLLVLSGACFIDGERVEAGEGFWQWGKKLQLDVATKNTHFLFVGVNEPGEKKGGSKFLLNSAKKVNKPWGYELWLTQEDQPYSLKQIFLKKGQRTSLQFHRRKHETNLLFSGAARFQYGSEKMGDNEIQQNIHINELRLSAPCFIDIAPFTLHRLTAEEDLLMYEASTSELDDVIRVEDDTFRGHGRIQSEHIT